MAGSATAMARVKCRARSPAATDAPRASRASSASPTRACSVSALGGGRAGRRASRGRGRGRTRTSPLGAIRTSPASIGGVEAARRPSAGRLRRRRHPARRAAAGCRARWRCSRITPGLGGQSVEPPRRRPPSPRSAAGRRPRARATVASSLTKSGCPPVRRCSSGASCEPASGPQIVATQLLDVLDRQARRDARARCARRASPAAPRVVVELVVAVGADHQAAERSTARRPRSRAGRASRNRPTAGRRARPPRAGRRPASRASGRPRRAATATAVRDRRWAPELPRSRIRTDRVVASWPAAVDRGGRSDARRLRSSSACIHGQNPGAPSPCQQVPQPTSACRPRSRRSRPGSARSCPCRPRRSPAPPYDAPAPRSRPPGRGAEWARSRPTIAARTGSAIAPLLAHAADRQIRSGGNRRFWRLQDDTSQPLEGRQP